MSAHVSEGFIRVRCAGCGNEQVIFRRAARAVTCLVCENTLAESTGGRVHLKGEQVEALP